jgi:hypothetical protein
MPPINTIFALTGSVITSYALSAIKRNSIGVN